MADEPADDDGHRGDDEEHGRHHARPVAQRVAVVGAERERERNGMVIFEADDLRIFFFSKRRKRHTRFINNKLDSH